MGVKGKDEVFVMDIFLMVNSLVCRMCESVVGNGVFGLLIGYKCLNRIRKCYCFNKCGMSLGWMIIKELS